MQHVVITLDDMNEFLQTLSALKENGLNGIVLPSTSFKARSARIQRVDAGAVVRQPEQNHAERF